MTEELDELGTRGFADYWAMVVRRRWAILLTLFVGWLAVWCMSWVVPSSYKSQAEILVEQQRIPEQYVVRNENVSLGDRLQSMTAQILSRTRLQATINRFHLYETHSRFTLTDDAVERMRKDIKISLVDSPARPGQLISFKIEYVAGSPQLAQEVNTELTSLFIDENLRFEQQLSESTTTFLQTQLTEARAKLEEQEAKVRAFKAAHFGDLPSETETNTKILSGLQDQLQESERALDGARQRKLYLESLHQEYSAAQARMNSGTSSTSSALQGMNDELNELRRRLEDARSRLTEEHPDVIALKDKIAQKELSKKELQAQLAIHPDAGGTPKVGEATAGDQPGGSNSLIQVQSQLKAIRLEVENSEMRVRDLEGQIATYRNRLNLTPQTEQELADVSRGYEESKVNYNSLLAKQNQSQLATSLEQRQQGQQFRILDPPTLPGRPSAPNHFRWSLAGLLAGTVGGLILAGLLEMMIVLVRQRSDIERIAQVRVLVGIPHIAAAGEARGKVLRYQIELGAAAVMGFFIVVGNLIALYKR